MRHSSILLSSFALLSLSACTVHGNCPPAAYAPTEQVWVKVDAPPPALRAEVEVQPARPTAAAVWVDGHFEWRGTWVWVDGFWDTPRAGYVWTAPVVVQVEGGYQYHPGYYRPARQTPPPVYTRPSTVRVSVRPAASATATGTVQVRTLEQPATGTVQVRTPEQPATGTVQVRGPSAHATTAAAGATVAASGTARVNAPTATATTSGTARVNAPTAAATAGGTARVNAPTASSGARVQGPTTAAVHSTPTMATAGGTAHVNAPTASAGATTPGPTMATVRPPTGSATVSGAATPSAGMGAVTPPPTEAGNLRCSLSTPRAPAGGYITINGNGFGNGTTVMIGGDLAAIQSRRGSQLRVEVPRGSGGAVQVTAGQRTATCGTLEVITR